MHVEIGAIGALGDRGRAKTGGEFVPSYVERFTRPNPRQHIARQFVAIVGCRRGHNTQAVRQRKAFRRLEEQRFGAAMGCAGQIILDRIAFAAVFAAQIPNEPKEKQEEGEKGELCDIQATNQMHIRHARRLPSKMLFVTRCPICGELARNKKTEPRRACGLENDSRKRVIACRPRPWVEQKLTAMK